MSCDNANNCPQIISLLQKHAGSHELESFFLYFSIWGKGRSPNVEIAAEILKNYFDEFRDSIKKDKSGQGFKKSSLYYMAKTYILQRDSFVDMKVPEWLLNSMCAVWNSEIGDENYFNANTNGSKSTYLLLKYLPKLVNE